MKLLFYKFQGTGNDFIMIDNRNKNIQLSEYQISRLCDRRYGVGADGCVFLENDSQVDFLMRYYNSDGKLGSFCGNGGRSIVIFSKMLGLVSKKCQFRAIDGLHFATCNDDGFVSLKMNDVKLPKKYNNGWLLDTGSPHLVFFKDSIDDIDVLKLGASIRYSDFFLDKGVNINFVSQKSNSFYLRTYERGVEDETLACGTGATAVALVACSQNLFTGNNVKINTLGGQLEISFRKKNKGFTDVYLKGVAKFIFKGEIDV